MIRLSDTTIFVVFEEIRFKISTYALKVTKYIVAAILIILRFDAPTRCLAAQAKKAVKYVEQRKTCVYYICVCACDDEIDENRRTIKAAHF